MFLCMSCRRMGEERCSSIILIVMEVFPLCFNSQNKIELFIPSEHNIYNHQHPSMVTCFGPFLDHPQDNIECKSTISVHYTLWDSTCLQNVSEHYKGYLRFKYCRTGCSVLDFKLSSCSICNMFSFG
jgi:hypothetical protein